MTNFAQIHCLMRYFFAISVLLMCDTGLNDGFTFGIFHILVCVFAGLTMLLHRSQADGDHDSRGRNRTRNLPVREGYL